MITTETPPEAAPPSAPRWPWVIAVLALVIGLAVAVLWPIRLPYFAWSPGPTEDVSDLITIAGVETFDTPGDFFLLTVVQREVNVFEYLEATLDERTDLIRRERIRPEGVTEEQQKRTSLQAMDSSIETAVFVALGRLGYDVGFKGDGVVVLDVVADSPADGVLQIDDVIDSIAGQAVTTDQEATDVIRSFAPGDTIAVEGSRGDEPLEEKITLAPHPDLEGAPMIGVFLDTLNLAVDLPLDVSVDSRNMGGPSAGLMYTLTVMDLLTEADMTRGHRIAGTGTIRFDESVGPIGGVRQKVFAARAIGAEYVLVPTDNYDAALTAVGDGIQIIPIATLQDALDFLDSLPPA